MIKYPFLFTFQGSVIARSLVGSVVASPTKLPRHDAHCCPTSPDRPTTGKHTNRSQSGTTSCPGSPVKAKMEVDNDLQCPVCLELFTCPVILPCSHVLCRTPCAGNLFDYKFIRCPVCRENCHVTGGLESLPRVLALDSIVQRYKAERQQTVDTMINESSIEESAINCNLCTGSPRKAEKSCVDCNASYCRPCLKVSHPEREPFVSHNLVKPRKNLKSKVSINCSQHSEQLYLYCHHCKRPFCLGCEKETHSCHMTKSLDEAAVELKKLLQTSLDSIQNSQKKIETALKAHKEGMSAMQAIIKRKKDEINMQCDALLAEVENKRSFFLADIEYEERVGRNEAEEVSQVLVRLLATLRSLHNYARDITEKGSLQILQIGDSLNERLLKASSDCDSCRYHPPEIDEFLNKVVDFRRERECLRDLYYLTPPAVPAVDVTKCSRSENTVALIMCAPYNIHDVADSYEVHYCSEEQKAIGFEDVVVFDHAENNGNGGNGSSGSETSTVILLDNLITRTNYYFCLSASNVAGKSATSDVVQCNTLAQGENVIPVPIIIESLCSCFASSIQIYSSSPLDVTVEQQISHFLLYRQATQNRAWNSVCLYGRQDHRIFGLNNNTDYEFVILACNQRGECQLSNKTVLQTTNHSAA
ncbi:hypothetical protein ScPMuIL_008308 [Solemya velum]